MLREIAPGCNLEADILAHMDFRPLIADPLTVMDSDIFRRAQAHSCSQALATGD